MRSAILALAAVAAAPGVARAGSGDALVRYVPDNAAEIIVLDVAHARSGVGVEKVVAQLRARSPRWEAVAAGGVELGLAIDTLVAASTTEQDPAARHAIAIVDGKVGPILAHLKTEKSRGTQYGGVTIWSIEGAEAAIVDHHLLITTPGEMTAAIDRGHRKQVAAPSNVPVLRAILGAAAGSGADVWGGTLFDARDRAVATQQLGGDPLWIAFAIAISARATLDARVAFVDEAGAHAVQDALQHMLVGPDAQLHPTLAALVGPEFADAIVVDQDGAQVRLTAAMSSDEAEQLGGLLGSNL